MVTKFKLLALGFAGLSVAVSGAACSDDATTGAGGAATVSSSGVGGGAGTGGQGSGGMSSLTAPSNLQLAVEASPFGARATWDPPAGGDAAGYVVARASTLEGLVNATPQDGTVYFPSDLVGTDAHVTYNGTAPAAFDPQIPVDAESHVAVWAFDDQGRYGPPATGSLAVTLPEQRVRVRLDGLGTASVTATVTEPATHAIVAATVTEANGPTVTLEVSISNRGRRVWFNPKAVVKDLSSTAIVVGNGATVEGDKAFYLGPYALGVDQLRTAVFEISNFAAASLEFDLLIAHGKGMVTAQGRSGLCMFDLSGGVFNDGGLFGGIMSFSGVTKPYVDTGGNYQVRVGAFSEDGRYAIAGRKRSAPWLTRLDLTEGRLNPGPPLATALGYVSQPVPSPDGASFYVMVSDGGRYDSGSGMEPSDIAVVRVNAMTLAEEARVVVANAVPHHSSIGFDVSSDGTRAAVALRVSSEVAIVDLTTMTAIDADPNTAGQQHVAIGMEPIRVVFDQAGEHVIALRRQADDAGNVMGLRRINVASLEVTPFPESSVASGMTSRHGSMVLASDGRVWVAKSSSYQPHIVDFNTGIATPLGITTSVRAFATDGDIIYMMNQGGIEAFNTDLVSVDLDLNSNNGPDLSYSFSCRANHHALVTPF